MASILLKNKIKISHMANSHLKVHLSSTFLRYFCFCFQHLQHYAVIKEKGSEKNVSNKMKLKIQSTLVIRGLVIHRVDY